MPMAMMSRPPSPGAIRAGIRMPKAPMTMSSPAICTATRHGMIRRSRSRRVPSATATAAANGHHGASASKGAVQATSAAAASDSAA